ncbi:MAG: hypothetical protein E5W03_05915 [Mesorhizobium sp.]|nr:MAG: hypothetical protein E5W03_05915 [Mesorhizobium sp.]
MEQTVGARSRLARATSISASIQPRSVAPTRRCASWSMLRSRSTLFVKSSNTSTCGAAAPMVRNCVSVVVIVLKNGVLGFQRHAEAMPLGPCTSACHFAPVDHAAIARACGCGATVVRVPDDIGPALEALASERPWLVKVVAAPNAHPALSLFGGAVDQNVVRDVGSV